MANDRLVRLYVSTLYTGKPGFAVVDQQATELLTRLKDAGYDVYSEKKHRAYPNNL